jgi:serine/threonine protein kinase
MLGRSLESLLHKKKTNENKLHVNLTFEKKLLLLLDVAKGMIYLHGLQPALVHRDLKPSVCDYNFITNTVESIA